MYSNFENDDIYVNVNIYVNKKNKHNKFNMNNNEDNVNKILITRKRDSRYAYKNRRIVNKDWKDFNNGQSICTQADWNWDLCFDWDLEYDYMSIYQDNSSIQASPGGFPASPALTYCSSSSYLKSFDGYSLE